MNGARKDGILRAVQGAEDNAEILVMNEAGAELGYVVVDVKSSTLRILKMELCGNDSQSDAQSHMCADSMMRAAASYGATVGAYQIESLVPAFNQQFQSCGFVLSQGKVLCPLEKIVRICNR